MGRNGVGRAISRHADGGCRVQTASRGPLSASQGRPLKDASHRIPSSNAFPENHPRRCCGVAWFDEGSAVAGSQRVPQRLALALSRSRECSSKLRLSRRRPGPAAAPTRLLCARPPVCRPCIIGQPPPATGHRGVASGVAPGPSSRGRLLTWRRRVPYLVLVLWLGRLRRGHVKHGTCPKT